MRIFSFLGLVAIIAAGLYGAWYYGLIGQTRYFSVYKFDYGGVTETNYTVEIPSEKQLSRSQTVEILEDNPYKDGFPQDYIAPVAEIEISCSTGNDGELDLIYRYNVPNSSNHENGNHLYTFTTDSGISYDVRIDGGIKFGGSDVRRMVWGIERAKSVTVSSSVTRETTHDLIDRGPALSKLIKKCRQLSDSAND